MARTVTVTLPDGRQAQATEVDIDVANERWSEYTLVDGTVVKVKLNLVSIVRVPGEYDLQGNPFYQFNASPTVNFVNIPDHLKRPKQ